MLTTLSGSSHLLGEFFLKSGHHLLGVCHADTCLIRFTAVRQELYRGILRVHDAVGKLRPENNNKVYFSLFEKFCCCFFCLDFPFSYEIVIGIEPLGQLFGVNVAALVKHCDTDILDLILNDIARQQYHNLRHDQKYQQRTWVAQDMYKFLADET